MGKSLQIITEHHALDFNLELLKRTISTYGLKVDFKIMIKDIQYFDQDLL